MATPTASDHLPVARVAFSGASFFPVEEVMSEFASMPSESAAARGSVTRNTRSRAAAPRAGGRNSTMEAAAIPSVPNAPRSSQRKRRAASGQNPSPAAAPRKRARASSAKKEKPSTETEEDDRKPAASESCCICMCDVELDDLAGISGCEHKFCFECIEKWAQRENSCPLCKNRFTKIDRVNKKRKKGQKNTKKVKPRDQRSDFGPGVALEGLLATLSQRSNGAPNIARLFFSGTTIGMGGERRYYNPFGDFSEDEDEDESPLSSFIRAFQSVQLPTHALRPVTFSAHVTSRSYATNSNDQSAGNRAENPLEIDDDSDDDVEVVQVNNTQR